MTILDTYIYNKGIQNNFPIRVVFLDKINTNLLPTYICIN